MDDNNNLNQFNFGRQVDGFADGEEPVVFYHKTGEFRKFESQAAADLATGKNKPKTGLFRVLVSNKQNKAIFIVLCMTFAIVILTAFLGRGFPFGKLNDISCEASSYVFKDQVLVTVSMLNKSKSLPVQNVEVDVQIYNNDDFVYDVFSQTISVSSDKTQVQKAFSDYDAKKIIVKLSTPATDKILELESAIKRK